MEIKEQLQKIISKYVRGIYVKSVEGTKADFKATLVNKFGESVEMEYTFPFGAGLDIGKIFACQGITKKLGELLQNLKSIEIDLNNLNKGEKNDGKDNTY